MLHTAAKNGFGEILNYLTTTVAPPAPTRYPSPFSLSPSLSPFSLSPFLLPPMYTFSAPLAFSLLAPSDKSRGWRFSSRVEISRNSDRRKINNCTKSPLLRLLSSILPLHFLILIQARRRIIPSGPEFWIPQERRHESENRSNPAQHRRRRAR